MENEIWKNIPETHGHYQISNYGNVRSNYSGTWKKINPCKHNTGSLYVNLWYDEKYHGKLVPRLVAEAFIPNTKGFSDVIHIDHNLENNYFENLKWSTRNAGRSSTGVRRVQVKLTSIKNDTVILCESIAQCARYLNVNIKTVRHHLYNVNSPCKGFNLEILE